MFPSQGKPVFLHDTSYLLPAVIFFCVERAGPYLTLGFDGACGLGWGGQTRAKEISHPLIITYLLIIPILYLNPKYPYKPVSVSVYGKHTYCCDR